MASHQVGDPAPKALHGGVVEIQQLKIEDLRLKIGFWRRGTSSVESGSSICNLKSEIFNTTIP
jgi:hypothetical protein